MFGFHQLSHAKQISLVGSGVVLALLLYFLLVWQPVNANLKAQQIRYENTVQTLQAVEESIAHLQSLQQADSNSISNLTTLVNQSLQERGLEFTRLQQLSTDQVQIRLDNVDFGEALAWIYGIENTPGVIVSELTSRAANSDQAGLVNLNVSLIRVD